MQCREKHFPQDDAFINDYITKSKKRINDYSNSNNLIKAERECKLSINMLDGLTNEVNWFKEKDASLQTMLNTKSNGRLNKIYST